MQTTELKPLLTAEVPGDDYDNGAVVLMFDRKVGVPAVLGALGLDTVNRASFNPDQPGTDQQRRYKDSGQWWHSRSADRTMQISVDVGCFCSHDCCGHQCGQYYEIALTSRHIVVIDRRSYNY